MSRRDRWWAPWEGADTPEGPHVEFQVRVPQGTGSPQAQDPLAWLRPRSPAAAR